MDIDWPTTIPHKLQQTCYAKTTSCKEKKSKKKTNFFCHLLRADPNVLLIKAETTRPHYSSSLSLSPILLPSLQRHERVVFRTVAGHACPRVLYLPSFSRTFHSSLLVFPVRLSLFISSSLPFDHGVCTTRADHNTRYPWRHVLSPFTQFVF